MYLPIVRNPSFSYVWWPKSLNPRSNKNSSNKIFLDFKKPFLTLKSAFEHCLLPRMHLSLFIYLPLPCLPSITVLVCRMQKMTQNARKIQFRNSPTQDGEQDWNKMSMLKTMMQISMITKVCLDLTCLYTIVSIFVHLKLVKMTQNNVISVNFNHVKTQ